uniref:Uncharacterized protein n=1 Tax=Panagrolaimus davidi TaxID=227884 RepID=A0A914QD60_9BILA
MLVIFENNAFSYNIRVKKHESLKIEINIDLNNIYNITLTNVIEKTTQKLKSLLDSNDEKSYFSQVPHAPEYLLQKTDFVILSKSKDYNPNFNAIGIDLGTTECCAAVIRKNGPDFVVLDQTSNLLAMPSYVAFDEKEPKCGKVALDRMRYKSEYTVYDSKRIIGKDFERIAVDPLWPFDVLNLEGNVFLQMKTYNNDVLQKRPEEISADLLLHIKKMLEQYQGNILIEAVITIPSEYSERQKQATKIAAKMSGFQTIHFIPEPVAAAFAYFTEINIPNLSNILICDCGGGTTDLCWRFISWRQGF